MKVFICQFLNKSIFVEIKFNSVTAYWILLYSKRVLWIRSRMKHNSDLKVFKTKHRKQIEVINSFFLLTLSPSSFSSLVNKKQHHSHSLIFSTRIFLPFCITKCYTFCDSISFVPKSDLINAFTEMHTVLEVEVTLITNFLICTSCDHLSRTWFQVSL